MSEWSASPRDTALRSPSPESAAVRALSRARACLRSWGVKSVLSLIDQGFISLTGFAVNLLLARWLAPDLYGAFALAYAALVFIAGFHSVLLLEPLSVIGPSRHASSLQKYFGKQIIVHLILVGALSLGALIGGFMFWRTFPRSPLVGSIFGSALMLPCILLLWLVRRMCYVVQRPGLALYGSTSYFCLALLGLFAFRFARIVTPLRVFFLLGGAGLAAAWFPLIVLGAFGAGTSYSFGWRAVLNENWTYGRWLVGSAILFPLANQTQMFLVAGSLGLGAAGVLRAMQLPSLVMTQVTTAVGLLLLPALSYDFGSKRGESLRRKMALVSLGLGIMALLLVAVLAIAAAPAERLLFAGKYAAYAWLLPVLALIPLANAFSTGYAMALRASQKPQFDFLANSVAAPVGIFSAIVFIRWWGLAGAAASMVASSFACAIVVYQSVIRKLTCNP